jgi:Glycosyltransferase family 87
MSSTARQTLQATLSWATPERLQMFLAAYFMANLLPFVYSQVTTTGVVDRLGRVRGRDFIAFYTAGLIVNEGRYERLYDQDYFLTVQVTLASVTDERPRHFSLYPPPMLLLFGLMARLPYDFALWIWWLAQAGAIAAAGWLLLKDLPLAPVWRRTVIVAFLAFAPVLDVFVNGQMSGFWLLILTAGLYLRRHGYTYSGGMLLALLALKPTLALGLVVWIVVRGQLRLGVGFALGCLALIGITAAFFGTDIFPVYWRSTQEFAQVRARVTWSAYHMHAVFGILRNLAGGESAWIKVVHLLVAAVAGVVLVRIAWIQGRSQVNQDLWRIDEASLVLFILLATPYILTYDLCLLLIPICKLWSLNRGKDGFLPVAAATMLYLFGMMLPLYSLLRFSLVPAGELVAIICLGCLARRGYKESA